MARAPKVYEQRPDEGPEAFAAFAVYRDQGLARSHAATALAVDKVKSLMSRWAKAYEWRSRALAYDREADRTTVDLTLGGAD